MTRTKTIEKKRLQSIELLEPLASNKLQVKNDKTIPKIGK